MSEEMFNPYKLELTREEMLEQFYRAIVDIDVLGGIKDNLLEEGEIEAWANIEVLQGGLRTNELAPAPTDTAPVGGETDVDFAKLRAWAFHWKDGNHISVDDLNQESRKLLEQYDLERFAHQVNAERGNDWEAEAARLQQRLRDTEAALAAARAAANDYCVSLDAIRGNALYDKRYPQDKATHIKVRDAIFTEASTVMWKHRHTHKAAQASASETGEG